MKINFEFDGVSTAGDLRDKLDRYLRRMSRKVSSFRDEFKTVWVKVRKRRGVYEVVGKMKLPGRDVVVKERDDRLLGALGRVRSGLLRAIEKYKRR